MSRILFCVDTYHPAQDGVAEVTRYMAEGLAKQNDVMVMSSLRGATLTEEKYNNVLIKRISNKRHYHLLMISGDKKETFKKIYNFSPDVLIIVSFYNWAYNWLVPHLNEFDCIKIFYNHGWTFTGIKEIVERIKSIRIRKDLPYDIIQVYKAIYLAIYSRQTLRNINKFDKVVYLHDHEEFYLLSLKKGYNNSVVIENSVEDIFFDAEKKRGVENDKLTFLCIANFVERKNQELLISAYKKSEFNQESRLVLIGSKQTDYYTKLLKKSENLPSNKEIILLCGLSREEVIEWYRNADVFLLASHAEWSPVVLREAAAMQLAIISTRVGDAENIDGIIIAEDEKDFCRELELMCDEDYRHKHGILNYEWALLHCERKRNVNRLQREIDNLIRGKQ